MKNKMQMLVNFIAKPAVLLLDEPLTSFDVVVADEMKGMLRAMKEEHIIIFSTHIMELALDLCDEIVILNNGALHKIEKKSLNNMEYKDSIIAALKEERNDWYVCNLISVKKLLSNQFDYLYVKVDSFDKKDIAI